MLEFQIAFLQHVVDFLSFNCNVLDVKPAIGLINPVFMSLDFPILCVQPLVFSYSPLMFSLAPSLISVCPVVFSYAPVWYSVIPECFVFSPIIFSITPEKHIRKTVKRSFTGGYFDAVNLEQKRKGAAFREEFEPPSVPVDARQANEAASVDNFPVGPVSVKIHLNIEMPSNDSVVKERLKPAKFGSRTRAWDKHNIFASSPTGKPNQKIAKRPIESRDPWSKILHREPFGHHAEVARKSEAIGYPSRRSPVTKPSQSRTAFQIISRMNDLVSLVGGIPEMSSLSNRTDEKVTSLQDPGFDDSRSKSVLKMLRSPKIETAKPTREAETPSDFSNFECRLEAKVNMITFAWPEVPSIVLNTKNSPSTLEPTLSAMPTSTETNFVTIPKLTTIKTSTSLKPMEFPIPPQFNVPSAVLHPLSPLTSIQEAPPSKDCSGLGNAKALDNWR
ncbi:unnamed protein product [Notodromas monacha]|uniref:Uncharacterized protein n=1 Tax=Notodromas monacha TaxID=399045 RepID=A0A7R9BDS8_9CRUS|nr:unnamed protein product [Notodromas monacha]CAG0913541.1 unnamed protein product [Notodromas monacha]